MRRKSTMKAGMAMTTTQAPSVNLETKKTTVAMAGDARAEAVDGGAAAPAGRALAPPVHDQPGFGRA
jgi:hypothetical protein